LARELQVLNTKPRQSKPMRAIRTFASIIFVPAVLGFLTSAQKPASEKFKHAVERSEDSARLLALLAEPNSGFPKELVDRARMVAVFPRTTRQDVLVRRFLQGYGVISSRQRNGWSLPSFYQFASAPRKFSGGSVETLALVLLFMNKDSVSWLDKDKSEFKGERAARLGPVGVVTGDQIKSLADTQILAYSYYNGKLNASNIDPDFFRDFILEQDNNLNTSLYGVKGREVLAGKQIDSLPAGISFFQDALKKYWPSR